MRKLLRWNHSGVITFNGTEGDSSPRPVSPTGSGIPPKGKKWLKQCVEFARNAP